MKSRLFALVLLGSMPLTPPPPLSAQEAENTCVACHQALGGSLAEPVALFSGDVHAEAGFSCASCHGGDPTVAGPEAMDPAKGYAGVPGPQQIPELCGRCHSNAELMRRYDPSLRVDQLAEYVTSVHGHQLIGAGDTTVANCASCHRAHSIRPSSDPNSSTHPLTVAETCGTCHADEARMAPYGIPTDQKEKYERSVHWHTMSEGGDTSAPTCNDCHGNHGATPPGISWVGNVCGQCHVVMAENFAESRHAETFVMLGIPGCAACHGNHDIQPAGDETLGLGEAAVCRVCHSADDPGGRAATTMRGMVDSLGLQLDTARVLLERAENSGMEVSGAMVQLNDAQSELVKARASIHTFDVTAVGKEVEAGLEIAGQSFIEGEEALRDLQIRRLGLAVSVFIIGALILGLVLKIRQIEQPE
jgi:hypothetical protein